MKGIDFSGARGVLALLFRSLRIDARSLSFHLVWVGLLAVLYGAMWVAQEMSSTFGAPGVYFFRYVMYMDAVVISLLGLSYFSSAISEEKEEDTLGLMMMAGIGGLGILLGKSTSRMVQVALLILLQYPFTLLSITLGGLLPGQIQATYMALGSYTLLIANVALLSSVLCSTNRAAASLTSIWFLAYLVTPSFAFGGLALVTSEYGWSEASSDPVIRLVVYTLNAIGMSNVFYAIYVATETGGGELWTYQVVTNIVGGVISFLMAWGLFGWVSKEPVTSSSARGLVARPTSRVWRLFRAGRVWQSPLIWKDFFFTAGGWAGLWIRTLGYAFLYGMIYYSHLPYTSLNDVQWQNITESFQWVIHPLLAADLALTVSRIFHVEIRNQTLSTLMMLPISTLQLTYTKLLGGLLVTLPGFAALLMSFFFQGGTRLFENAYDEVGFWYWVTNLLFLIHMSLAFSLFLRSGAFVLAVGATIGMNVLAVLMMIGTGNNGEEVMIVFVMILMLGACAFTHVMLVARLPYLAEK